MDTSTLVAVAVMVLALAGGVYYLLARWRRQQRTQGEAFLHFRCRRCRRRLRFRAPQAGHKGKCSHCGQDVTFPRADQSID